MYEANETPFNFSSMKISCIAPTMLFTMQLSRVHITAYQNVYEPKVITIHCGYCNTRIVYMPMISNWWYAKRNPLKRIVNFLLFNT